MIREACLNYYLTPKVLKPPSFRTSGELLRLYYTTPKYDETLSLSHNRVVKSLHTHRRPSSHRLTFQGYLWSQTEICLNLPTTSALVGDFHLNSKCIHSSLLVQNNLVANFTSFSPLAGSRSDCEMLIRIPFTCKMTNINANTDFLRP